MRVKRRSLDKLATTRHLGHLTTILPERRVVVQDGRRNTYFHTGINNAAPMTFSGMPSASRIRDRSCDPNPPSSRHILVESSVIGTPHSSWSPARTCSSTRAALLAMSSAEKSVNLRGKVADCDTKVEFRPMMSVFSLNGQHALRTVCPDRLLALHRKPPVR